MARTVRCGAVLTLPAADTAGARDGPGGASVPRVSTVQIAGGTATPPRAALGAAGATSTGGASANRISEVPPTAAPARMDSTVTLVTFRAEQRRRAQDAAAAAMTDPARASSSFRATSVRTVLHIDSAQTVRRCVLTGRVQPAQQHQTVLPPPASASLVHRLAALMEGAMMWAIVRATRVTMASRAGSTATLTPPVPPTAAAILTRRAAAQLASPATTAANAPRITLATNAEHAAWPQTHVAAEGYVHNRAPVSAPSTSQENTARIAPRASMATLVRYNVTRVRRAVVTGPASMTAPASAAPAGLRLAYPRPRRHPLAGDLRLLLRSAACTVMRSRPAQAMARVVPMGFASALKILLATTAVSALMDILEGAAIFTVLNKQPAVDMARAH